MNRNTINVITPAVAGWYPYPDKKTTTRQRHWNGTQWEGDILSWDGSKWEKEINSSISISAETNSSDNPPLPQKVAKYSYNPLLSNYDLPYFADPLYRITYFLQFIVIFSAIAFFRDVRISLLPGLL
jgi:hypothetical protein